MIAKQRNKRSLGQQGSFMLFFALGVLPLLMLMFAISVDISSYLRADQRLQESADDAALLAWRYLPYQDVAKKAVQRFIATRGLEGAITQIGLSAPRPGADDYRDEFEIVLEQNISLSFASYFLADLSLPLKAVARTRTTPLDVFIALDRSNYMAPDSLDEIWSNADSSGFFESLPVYKFIDPESGREVSSPPSRFMAQRCYNPYFAKVKEIATTIYEYLSAVGRNGVGVGVFPGVFFEDLYTLRGVLRPAQNSELGNLLSGEARALEDAGSTVGGQDYYVYRGLVNLGASSWCSGAATFDATFANHNPYGGELGDPIQKLWVAPSDFAMMPSEIIRKTGSFFTFNPSYRAGLSIRESIWSAVAKASVPNSPGVLEAVISNLAVTPDSESINNYSVRGGLTGTSTRTGIILAGDVPHFQGIRFSDETDVVSEQLTQSFVRLGSILNQQPELKFRILYVIMDDDTRPSSSVPEIEIRAQRLAEFFNAQKTILLAADSDLSERLDLQVIWGKNLQELSQEIISIVLLDNQRRVLSY